MLTCVLALLPRLVRLKFYFVERFRHFVKLVFEYLILISDDKIKSLFDKCWQKSKSLQLFNFNKRKNISLIDIDNYKLQQSNFATFKKKFYYLNINKTDGSACYFLYCFSQLWKYIFLLKQRWFIIKNQKVFFVYNLKIYFLYQF